MTRNANLIGLRFGRLLALRHAEERKYGWQYWCRCDCGVEKIVDGGSMKRGGTVSCGCHRAAVRKRNAAFLFQTKNCVTCGKLLQNVRAAEIACSAVCHALAYIIPEPNSGCWLWLGTLNTDGYAAFEFKGRGYRAHQVLYDEKFGAPAPGLERDHLCRTRCCSNPDHIEAVTHLENVRRGLRGIKAPSDSPGGEAA